MYIFDCLCIYACKIHPNTIGIYYNKSYTLQNAWIYRCLIILILKTEFNAELHNLSDHMNSLNNDLVNLY